MVLRSPYVVSALTLWSCAAWQKNLESRTKPAEARAPLASSRSGERRATAAQARPAATQDKRAPATPPELSCPDGMLLMARPSGAYCIDRYEASLVSLKDPARGWPGNQKLVGNEAELRAVSRAGVKPQGYISGSEAAVVCANAHKRLCEIDEWVRACRGPKISRYPYGNDRRPNLCNDREKTLDRHPVPRLFNEWVKAGKSPGPMWHPSFMNEPALHEFDHSVSETGAFAGCTNEFGAYDMVGNLHEWVADANGTFLGGFFMDTFQNGEGCEYRTLAHPFDYHDYSTGFRCCSDPSVASITQR